MHKLKVLTTVLGNRSALTAYCVDSLSTLSGMTVARPFTQSLLSAVTSNS